MTASASRRTLLILSCIFATAGVVLAHRAWLADPRLRFPATFTYVVASVALIAAVMTALQGIGIQRWNDLLAAVLLFAVGVEFFWLAFGPGRRPCHIGWWQPPETVCRTGLALGALVSSATALWALRRHLQRTRTE